MSRCQWLDCSLDGLTYARLQEGGAEKILGAQQRQGLVESASVTRQIDFEVYSISIVD